MANIVKPSRTGQTCQIAKVPYCEAWTTNQGDVHIYLYLFFGFSNNLDLCSFVEPKSLNSKYLATEMKRDGYVITIHITYITFKI